MPQWKQSRSPRTRRILTGATPRRTPRAHLSRAGTPARTLLSTTPTIIRRWRRVRRPRRRGQKQHARARFKVTDFEYIYHWQNNNALTLLKKEKNCWKETFVLKMCDAQCEVPPRNQLKQLCDNHFCKERGKRCFEGRIMLKPWIILAQKRNGRMWRSVILYAVLRGSVFPILRIRMLK